MFYNAPTHFGEAVSAGTNTRKQSQVRIIFTDF
uniref:Uncharacterized protein n=1 Tax=Anguilla anguilla TaxID=7936 RepID=A0A0E9TQG7_ANGAN